MNGKLENTIINVRIDLSFIIFQNYFKVISISKSENNNSSHIQHRDIHITYRVLKTIQMKLILLCVWAEQAVLGSAKTQGYK